MCLDNLSKILNPINNRKSDMSLVSVQVSASSETRNKHLKMCKGKVAKSTFFCIWIFLYIFKRKILDLIRSSCEKCNHIGLQEGIEPRVVLVKFKNV
jgi:hypothetical protein